MALETRGPALGKDHRIVLENRERLCISGVDEVERFDETMVVLSTSRGDLTICGQGLHIEQLSLDGGDLLVEGTVDSIQYEEPRGKGGLLARLLG